MKTLTFTGIDTGQKAPFVKDVATAIQDYYVQMTIASVKQKIGAYSATKAYMFGSMSMTYSLTGGAAFTAPDGGYCLYNGNIYTVAAGASANAGGNKLALNVVNIQKKFSDNAFRDLIVERTIIQDNGAGTILNTDIVPLFIYEIITDWVALPAAAGATSALFAKREGNQVYVRGSGAGNGSDQVCTIPAIFQIVPNSGLGNQYVTVKEGVTLTGSNYFFDSLGTSFVVNGGAAFICVNASYRIF